MNKKESRIRRARKTRSRIKTLEATRLCVFRSPRHIYAQIISASGGDVLASASTTEKDVKGGLKYSGNVEAASAVGKLIAERALAAGVDSVAFDRGGFKYQGIVAAVADGAREGGLTF